jgi:hypothetical protein
VIADSYSIGELFKKFDKKSEGYIGIEQYKEALEENPYMFNWFELLNQGGSQKYA